MQTNYVYIGQELELFSRARQWKSYWGGIVKPFLGKEVLEVGAGIGSNTELLCSKEQKRWVCLEPDIALLQQLRTRISKSPLKKIIEIADGTLDAIAPSDQFDSVLYVDVLEHIEDDRKELQQATNHLRPGANLVVLAPAHQFLFTPFDDAVGHYRRYSKSSLRRITPPSLSLQNIYYLDSVGLLASVANKLFLRKSLPTESQICIWDQKMVPLSVFIDRQIRFKFGKSVLAQWNRLS